MMGWAMLLIRPWLVTLLIEMVVAWLLGVRGKKDQLVIFLVNTITNPVVNLTLMLTRIFCPMVVSRTLLPVLELTVFLVEAFLFRSCLKNNRNPLRLSLVCNAASFFLGGALLTFL